MITFASEIFFGNATRHQYQPRSHHRQRSHHHWAGLRIRLLWLPRPHVPLREEGVKVSLINSNPATIMTDPVTADHVYLLPLEPESIIQILKEQKIDAVLPTMGGQTALNLAMQCDEMGIWAEYGVKMIRGGHPCHRNHGEPGTVSPTDGQNRRGCGSRRNGQQFFERATKLRSASVFRW